MFKCDFSNVANTVIIVRDNISILTMTQDILTHYKFN